ncbi:hypothetical protein [Virgibacillus sp. W0181]|uniref:hypothetical protein n=1 Tax=Virgibacillus sp. W0181 TaxID=3391581 RepID=UPI003F6E1B24
MVRKSYFILIENQLFVNVEQSILRLYLDLLTKTNPFTFFERKPRNRVLNLFPAIVLRAIRVLNFTVKFYERKKEYKRNKSTILSIETNYYGNLLLQLRQGEQKIFNLKDKLVLTSFSKHTPPEDIETLICNIQKSTVCKLAPNIITWDKDEYYIVEEYINLKRPSYSINNLDRVYSEVFPILENISFSTTPELVKIEKYTHEKLQCVKSLLREIQLKDSNSSYRYQEIEKFLCYTKSMIKNNKVDEIALASSHGDFWEGNILINKSARVIDWNTYGKRSMYFDIYYFLFMLASIKGGFNKVNNVEIKKLSGVVGGSFDLYYEKLKTNIDFKHTYNLQEPKTYRYIFYIELIVLKLDEINSKKGKICIDEVMTWISRFMLLEENMDRKSEFSFDKGESLLI